jgi:hypothetical protein
MLKRLNSPPAGDRHVRFRARRAAGVAVGDRGAVGRAIGAMIRDSARR